MRIGQRHTDSIHRTRTHMHTENTCNRRMRMRQAGSGGPFLFIFSYSRTCENQRQKHSPTAVVDEKSTPRCRRLWTPFFGSTQINIVLRRAHLCVICRWFVYPLVFVYVYVSCMRIAGELNATRWTGNRKYNAK